MSQFGPPNGPASGPPPQPWPTGASGEGSNQPADPWRDQEGWGGAPSSTPPDSGAPTSPLPSAGNNPGPGDYPHTQRFQPGVSPVGSPEPLWSPAPPAPPQKKSNTALIVVVAVLAVLVLGGGGTVAYLLTQDSGKKPVAEGTGSPSDNPSGQPNASDQPDAPDQPGPSGEPTADPTSGRDVETVQKGDCVKNDGTNDAPMLVPTKCGPGAYEVLARIDGPTTGNADAQQKCSSVPNSTNWYFLNSQQDDRDFVLCMKRL